MSLLRKGCPVSADHRVILQAGHHSADQVVLILHHVRFIPKKTHTHTHSAFSRTCLVLNVDVVHDVIKKIFLFYTTWLSLRSHLTK